MTTVDRRTIVDAWLKELPQLGTAVDVRSKLAVIVDAVLDDELDRAGPAVEEIVRLHAVHDLPASKAVSFLPLLEELLRTDSHAARTEVNERINRLLLAAFDSYVACRERLWQIKWNERARRTWLLDRLDGREEGPAAPAGSTAAASRP